MNTYDLHCKELYNTLLEIYPKDKMEIAEWLNKAKHKGIINFKECFDILHYWGNYIKYENRIS